MKAEGPLTIAKIREAKKLIDKFPKPDHYFLRCRIPKAEAEKLEKSGKVQFKGGHWEFI